MPWLVPSHQALVLPLKRWRPRWFSGLALCLGSLAPDLEFIVRLGHEWVWSHTVAAQFYMTGPLVLLLHWLSTALVFPWLLPRLPDGRPLELHALSALRPATTVRAWATIASSGVVGGLTHIAVDGFTHGNHTGWALAYLPGLAAPLPIPASHVPLHDALQVVLTLLLGKMALEMWKEQATGLRRAGVRVTPMPLSTQRATLRGLASLAVAGMAFTLILREPVGAEEGIKLAAFGALTFAGLGVLLGAVWARVRSASRRPTDGAPALAAEAGAL